MSNNIEKNKKEGKEQSEPLEDGATQGYRGRASAIFVDRDYLELSRDLALGKKPKPFIWYPLPPVKKP